MATASLEALSSHTTGPAPLLQGADSNKKLALFARSKPCQDGQCKDCELRYENAMVELHCNCSCHR